MPLYELGVIIDPEANPDEESSVIERLEKIITDSGGEIDDRDAWGRRQLAYPINKRNHGIYHFWKFIAEGGVISDLNFEMRTNDMVMRYLVLNLDRELRRHRKAEQARKAKAAAKAAKAEARAAAAAEHE
jgi:small subunit ribosomal protein S6